ncbi:hypothetical protein X907_0564 [Glycocaulis alkaliphilus]|uniref:Uncharacterized protein n=1 Tax=Glycocaulis alkaliphilus TaxID=1434191 RepID=A0A3T0E6T7_9PROT|nr:hypothetical protein [Glycocaulis alkaliphilus]AZU03111.1 hypothetical protein X907_0564 [Glycocaulis alkaliphilus]GGB71081.1 hypothetical protein GCM10007417_08590 [Glycocaulis alkaliphilus]
MTIKHLLGGVAAAALLTGATFAQQVTVTGAGDFQGQVVALEGGQDLAGDLVLEFDLSGAFAGMGAGGAVRLDIQIDGATFDGPVSNTALVSAGANCGFGAAPSLGGGAGGNTVRFSSTGQLNLCAAGTATITLPIEATTFGEQISVSATFTATADAGTYGPVVSLDVDADDIVSFDNALTYSIAAGAAGAGELDANGENLLGSGILGVLSVAYDDTLNYDLADTLAAANIGTDNLVASGELTVTLASAAGIDFIELDGVDCPATGNVFTCAVDIAQLEIDGAHDITFDVDGNGAVAQTPSASLSLVADGGANADADVFDGVAATDLAEITLDDGLDTSSLANANFAWVRFGTGGTESNFRIQFADADEANAVTEVRVDVDAGNGVDAQTVTLVAGTANDGFVVQGATITFNSRGLGAASGQSGNADITGVDLQHSDDEPGVGNGTILRQLINRNTASFVATPGLASDN